MKKRETVFSKTFSTYFTKTRLLFSSNIALRPALIGAFSLVLGVFTGTYIIPTNATFANTKIDAPASATSNKHTEYLSDKETTEKTELAAIASRTKNSVSTSSTRSTSDYTAGANLSIPSLGIVTSVSPSTLSGSELSVPSSTVSYYGTLLMGHSSGVFRNLPNARVGQEITYNGKIYAVDNVKINLEVNKEDRTRVGNYTMYVLTNLGPNRIVLMTCAGTYIPGQGYSGRTLVFATLK